MYKTILSKYFFNCTAAFLPSISKPDPGLIPGHDSDPALLVWFVFRVHYYLIFL